MKREPACRVFASEYNASKHVHIVESEKKVSYIITPMGCKINRLFFVGVLTEVTEINEEMLKTRIVDHTGAFYVTAGQYQPQAYNFLKDVKPPVIVAVVGKSRTYSPEEDTMYVSVSPERITLADEKTRDYWVFDAANKLKIRLEAMREALQMETPDISLLLDMNYSKNVAEGILLSMKYYSNVDMGRYSSILEDSLKYFLPEYKHLGYEMPSNEEEVKEENTAELEAKILEFIEVLSYDDNGAKYDDLLTKCMEIDLNQVKVDEILSILQEKGEIYEPLISRFKRI